MAHLATEEDALTTPDTAGRTTCVLLAAVHPRAVAVPSATAALMGARFDAVLSFVVLAQELSFTRAAELLFVSRSGLSRRLASLESCLNVCLLDRTTRQVELSDAGAALLPHARAIVAHVAAGSAGVRAVTEPAPAAPCWV